MYKKVKGTSLRQGDIIDRQKLVSKKTLVGHQDYFAYRKDFLGFCVVTQSCDLECDRHAEYISLAVIRNLLHTFGPEHVKNQDVRDSTKSLLRDILGQEYNKSGFFYLHPEASANIEENSVVDLRVMFSLHAGKHYNELLDCRKLSMSDAMANKLGWMAGQLFSRIPTPEWDEEDANLDLKVQIDRLMKDIKTQETPPESREVLLPADVYRALHEYLLESGLEAKVFSSSLGTQ
jgi:hypothetical protein